MFLEINLNKYNLQTYVRNGKEYFLNPIREKLIIKTPEEIVYQKIIKFLEKKLWWRN